MIYLDSSVLLAELFAETRCPSDAFWVQPLFSSRLLEYEVINRIHARQADALLGAAAVRALGRVTMFEMTQAVLARALEPFPVPVRTLDSLHLATMVFLRANGQALTLASYDIRLIAAAQALGFALAVV